MKCSRETRTTSNTWHLPCNATRRASGTPHNCMVRIGASSVSQNVKSCKQDGVKVVCIPQCGGKKTAKGEGYEKSSDFKKGKGFRAGIGGGISVLFRGRGGRKGGGEGKGGGLGGGRIIKKKNTR